MAYNPPTYGESGEVYTDNVRNSLDAVKSTAELAKSTADGLNASVSAAAQSADQAKEAAAAAYAYSQAPTDGRVATLVNDDASETKAALSASYATLTGSLGGNRLGIIGDSVSASGNNTGYQLTGTWAVALCVLSGGALVYGKNVATAGATTSAMVATQLPAILADGSLTHCTVAGGTNDLTDSNLTTANTAAANLATMYEALLAAGIVPIAATIPPRASNPITTARLNDWIVRKAAQLRIPVLDHYSLLVDPVASPMAYRTGYSGDAVHPAASSHRLLATADAAALDGWLTPWTPKLANNKSEATNGVGDGLFTTDDGSGHPIGWTASSTAGSAGLTFSFVTDADAAGRWWKWQRVGGAGIINASKQVSLASLGWNVGDTVEFLGKIRTTGVEAGGCNYSCHLSWVGSDGSSYLRPVYQWDNDIPAGVFYMRGVIPTGTTDVKFNLSMTNPTGTATLEVAQMTCRNTSLIPT